MGLLNWFGKKTEESKTESRSLENPAAPVTPLTIASVGGSSSDAGVVVNHDKALTFTALYAGISCIGATVGSLPFLTYERLERGKRRAADHPLFNLLRNSPNPESTAIVFWETLIANAILWGNGYAYIERDAEFTPTALWLLRPDRVKPMRIDGQLWYEVTAGGKPSYLDPSRVFHVPMLGTNGVVGLSIVDLFKQSIGLGLGSEKFGAKYFASGGNVRGVLTHTKTLTDTARKNIADSWKALHEGLDNSHRVAVLEEGMTFTPFQMNNETAQFLETRKFQVSEAARILRLPPHKVGDLERSTNNNIESQNIEFIQDSIQPWLCRIEQETNRKLFREDEKASFFAEFLIEGRLRGDSAARSAYYRELMNLGALTPNEIREMENRNPHADGVGDEPIINGAYLKLKDVGQPPAAPEGSQGDDERSDGSEDAESTGDATDAITRRRALQTAYADLLASAVERRMRKDAAAVLKKFAELGGNVGTFNVWVRKRTKDSSRVENDLRGVFRKYAKAVADLSAAEVKAADPNAGGSGEFVDKYVEGFAVRYNAALRRVVLGVSEGDDLADLQTRINAALEARTATAATVAAYEAARARQAFAREAFAAFGVTAMRWHACCESGECKALHNRSVDIGLPFTVLRTGTKPTNIYHAPLHEGCNCEVLPIKKGN